MAPLPALTIRAFAKINLDLRVGPVQSDGYHVVRTVLQTVRLHDTITVTPRRGPFAIACDTPGVPLDAFEALARTARQVGIPIAGHVPAAVGVHRAIEAGFRSIDHLDGYAEAALRDGVAMPASGSGASGVSTPASGPATHCPAMLADNSPHARPLGQAGSGYAQ